MAGFGDAFNASLRTGMAFQQQRRENRLVDEELARLEEERNIAEAGRQFESLFVNPDGTRRTAQDVLADPRARATMGRVFNNPVFSDILGENRRVVGFQAAGPDAPDQFTPIIEVIDPETGKPVSRGPLTENREAFDTNPDAQPVFVSPEDILEEIQARLVGRNPSVAQSVAASRAATAKRSALGTVFSGRGGGAPTPAPRAAVRPSAGRAPAQAPAQAPAPQPDQFLSILQRAREAVETTPTEGGVERLGGQLAGVQRAALGKVADIATGAGEAASGFLAPNVGAITRQGLLGEDQDALTAIVRSVRGGQLGRLEGLFGKPSTPRERALAEAAREWKPEEYAQARGNAITVLQSERDRIMDALKTAEGGSAGQRQLASRLLTIDSTLANITANTRNLPPKIRRKAPVIPKAPVDRSEAAADATETVAGITGGSYRPGSRLTRKQKQALITLHMLDPQSMPMETLERAIDTGRMRKRDLATINLGDGRAAILDRETMGVRLLDFGQVPKRVSPEDRLKLEKQRQAIITNFLKTRNPYPPKDERHAQWRSRVVNMTYSTPLLGAMGFDLGNPRHLNYLAGAAEAAEAFEREDESVIFGLGGEDRRFNTLTPFLAARMTNTPDEDMINAYTLLRNNAVTGSAEEVDTMLYSAMVEANKAGVPLVDYLKQTFGFSN